jgi:hypothetical protein
MRYALSGWWILDIPGDVFSLLAWFYSQWEPAAGVPMGVGLTLSYKSGQRALLPVSPSGKSVVFVWLTVKARGRQRVLRMIQYYIPGSELKAFKMVSWDDPWQWYLASNYTNRTPYRKRYRLQFTNRTSMCFYISDIVHLDASYMWLSLCWWDAIKVKMWIKGPVLQRRRPAVRTAGIHLSGR